MIKNIPDILGISRTTFWGAIAAGIGAIQPVMIAYQTGGAVIDWKQLATSFCIGAAFKFAADCKEKKF